MASCNRDDITQAGVYFLFCKEDDGSDSVYIGEAENVKERLVQHLRDHQAEKEKYYWTTAVIFIGRDLNKALIRYLENRFVEIARACKRYTVLTKNTYKNTVMKESQIAVMGHADIATTMNVYTHLKLEDAKDELKQMKVREQLKKEMTLADMEYAKKEIKRVSSI